MQPSEAHSDGPRPADAGSGWIERLPRPVRPYLRLSRYDRPAGFWLLALPCLAGLALACQQGAEFREAAALAPAFVIGAVAMRGAGCVWNDIIDRDIDARVRRTAGRPLPSGQVSLAAAIAWMVIQCAAGLIVLAMLPPAAQLIALLSLPLVALYPFMKRITWWPQVWLGLTFNWGFLVAMAAVGGELAGPALLVYAGLTVWTVGYDTIYALQDAEDDALVGVRSTARLFGSRAAPAIAAIYAAAAALIAIGAGLSSGPGGALATIPFAGHLAVQAVRLFHDGDSAALSLFRSNRDAALLLALTWALHAVLFSKI